MNTLHPLSIELRHQETQSPLRRMRFRVFLGCQPPSSNPIRIAGVTCLQCNYTVTCKQDSRVPTRSQALKARNKISYRRSYFAPTGAMESIVDVSIQGFPAQLNSPGRYRSRVLTPFARTPSLTVGLLPRRCVPGRRAVRLAWA